MMRARKLVRNSPECAQIASAHDQGSGHFVMQRLATLGKSGHGETEAQGQVAEDTREVSTEGPLDAHALAIQIRDFDAHGYFADRPLVFRAFHENEVKKPCEQCNLKRP
jgi:hypothetical protein